MTAAGRLEYQFNEFKKEVEARLKALENANKVASTASSKKSSEKKGKDIVLETKNDEIVASETEE